MNRFKHQFSCIWLFSGETKLSYRWYPPGHGNFYEAFYNSGLLDKFLQEGKQVFYDVGYSVELFSVTLKLPCCTYRFSLILIRSESSLVVIFSEHTFGLMPTVLVKLNVVSVLFFVEY